MSECINRSVRLASHADTLLCKRTIRQRIGDSEDSPTWVAQSCRRSVSEYAECPVQLGQVRGDGPGVPEQVGQRRREVNWGSSKGLLMMHPAMCPDAGAGCADADIAQAGWGWEKNCWCRWSWRVFQSGAAGGKRERTSSAAAVPE